MSQVKVGVTYGISGYFVITYDEDGPIDTGIGRYSTPEPAEQEAREWAFVKGLPLDAEIPRRELNVR